MTRPLLKYAGGKTQLLPQLFVAMGEFHSSGTYYEPFVGGGALFWAMRDTGWTGAAWVNDLNQELITTYQAVRDIPGPTVSSLQEHEREYRLDPEGYYYKIRSWLPKPTSQVAGRMIFLNKTCFNGLYRVNKSGQFNVPHGKFKTPPTICDEENLRACHRALANTAITSKDFEEVASTAEKGDLVYFDPPYDPASATSNFTAYTKEGFGLDDQRRLAALVWKLKKAGVYVILSSADTPTTRKLYPEGKFNILRVEARRSINSKGGRRGPVGELIIT